MRHSMNWIFFSCLILSFTVQAQWAALLPKVFAKPPKYPKPIDDPPPTKPDSPVAGQNAGKPAAEQNAGKPVEPAAPKPTPSPGPVQTNMARLEEVVSEAASEVLSEIVSQLAENLASALLGTSTASADAPDITTTSMDMSSYQPCIDYASMLSSCAAATSGFYYTDDLAVQAGCVCYTSSASCAATTYTTAFDDYAISCQSYLSSDGGYTAVADAMDDEDFYLGPYFCDFVNSTYADVYTTDGVPTTLDPTTCASAAESSKTGPTVAEESNVAVALLTPADQGILVTAGAIVAGLTGFLIW